MAPATLCYWDIRGLAQPIRLLLEYTGTDYEDKRLSCGPPPDFDKSCWLDQKYELGLDFPNLPYFIDGDIKITQSNAILRYIAGQHDLLGKTTEEKVRVDIMAEQSMDFRIGLVRLVYHPKFDDLLGDYLTGLKAKLSEFSAFLGERAWFAGDNVSFVDFVMYELLDQHRDLSKASIDAFANIAAFLNRFEKLAKIEAYMKTPTFLKAPANNKMAKFGNV